MDSVATVSYRTSIELVRDCLSTWEGNKGIGRIHMKTVYTKDLPDEVVMDIFNQYIDAIKNDRLAMPPEWKNIFLKTCEEVIELTLLAD